MYSRVGRRRATQDLKNDVTKFIPYNHIQKKTLFNKYKDLGMSRLCLIKYYHPQSEKVAIAVSNAFEREVIRPPAAETTSGCFAYKENEGKNNEHLTVENIPGCSNLAPP